MKADLIDRYVSDVIVETMSLPDAVDMFADEADEIDIPALMLEQSERAGLFLVSLDEVHGWWRYHYLFANLVRTGLQAEQPRPVQELHRAAAAWPDEQGLADDAVRTGSGRCCRRTV